MVKIIKELLKNTPVTAEELMPGDIISFGEGTHYVVMDVLLTTRMTGEKIAVVEYSEDPRGGFRIREKILSRHCIVRVSIGRRLKVVA